MACGLLQSPRSACPTARTEKQSLDTWRAHNKSHHKLVATKKHLLARPNLKPEIVDYECKTGKKSGAHNVKKTYNATRITQLAETEMLVTQLITDNMLSHSKTIRGAIPAYIGVHSRLL